jgi:hypothetical protein
MKTTIGGDRLGSGNKQQLSFKNYERSTHDLSYLWRSTMAPGTLVPFMSQVALPGDNWRIELNAEALTLPTVGPLFGSFKLQLDVFEVPIRLYNRELHQNKLGIGMAMDEIYFPRFIVSANNHADYDHTYEDNEQVNASALIKYLGISGIGNISGETNPADRSFNAIPILAYYEIYKQYYSNKQEEVGYYISVTDADTAAAVTPISASMLDVSAGIQYNCFDTTNTVTVATGDVVFIQYPSNCPGLMEYGGVYGYYVRMHDDGAGSYVATMLENVVWFPDTKVLQGTIKSSANGSVMYVDNTTPAQYGLELLNVISLHEFSLSDIDDTRDAILQDAGGDAFELQDSGTDVWDWTTNYTGSGATLRWANTYSQNGLAVKTYQSDLFNNWINTEWIDGETGVSALTAIDTSGGDFTIDALNIASKVYAMLNRIAVSGGSYDDWLDAVYTHERVKGIENPVYHGSLIKEIAFQEVISNASSETSAGESQPLGQLAGRGRLTNKHKGGLINIKVNEPSYIMGIVSITPRVEYSQGNSWDVNLETIDDLHKPGLDAIGFQDLLTDQLLWSDTTLDSTDGSITTNSLGKQPAWLNYMTNVNKVFGGFAERNNSMFMVLNRRYEADTDGSLLDGTTYIDPSKFNHIFAETALDAQNFWIQISCDITARRKMSAKVIPNL